LISDYVPVLRNLPEERFMPLKSLAGGLLLIALFAHAAVASDERYSHFQPVPSNSLEEAVANLGEYNRHLEAIVQQEQLSAMDVVNIHQLTYTLETALERLEEELETIADLLEEVHQASESADDLAALQRKGRVYLEAVRKLVP